MPALPAGIIGAAIAIHVAWESELIKNANKGDGVILTFLYAAPGVVIPSTRVAPQLDPNWATIGNGTFVSQGGDRVRYQVQHGAVEPGIVRFRLVNQSPSNWDKSFVLRDGGQEDLYAGQVKLGQPITFRKPQMPGIWVDAFAIVGLQGLQPGDQATFTWEA